MFCTSCGNKLEDDSLFCSYCGAKVEGAGNSIPIEPTPVKVESPAAPANIEEGTTLLESLSSDLDVPTPPTIVLKRASNGREYRISAYPALLGKGSAADVIVEGNPSISRVHACINAVGAALTMEDRGSMNGTSFNGEKLEAGRRPQLKDGCIIGLADETFTVRFE